MRPQTSGTRAHRSRQTLGSTAGTHQEVATARHFRRGEWLGTHGLCDGSTPGVRVRKSAFPPSRCRRGSRPDPPTRGAGPPRRPQEPHRDSCAAHRSGAPTAAALRLQASGPTSSHLPATYHHGPARGNELAADGCLRAVNRIPARPPASAMGTFRPPADRVHPPPHRVRSPRIRWLRAAAFLVYG
jgi:hypothetical protein